MAEYAKKKNDELATLCKERGLPHTGKKADLVKRLEENDAKGMAVPQARAAVEDDIDWDEEPAADVTPAAPTEAAAVAIAAGGIGKVANPVAVPNQVQVVDPAKTNDLTVVPPAEESTAPEESKKEEVDYSSHMAERTIDEEIQKRKARARKFGMPEDSDEIKMLERAKRFGTADLPGLLNKALPSGLDRKRPTTEGESDGGIRKRSRGRPGPGRGGRGGREGSDRPKAAEGRSKKDSGGHPSWMTEQDRRKADERKARFAGTPST